jgi:hypothetical protein
VSTAPETIATTAAAMLFGGIFVWGGQVHPFRSLIRDRRSIISFGGGMAAAYVFVHVMPELASMRRTFAASTSLPLRYEGMAIYMVALAGFMLYYGLDRLHRDAQRQEDARKRMVAFRLHIGGFGLYVCMMGYLLVSNGVEGGTSIGLFVLAIALHFLSIDHMLRREHGLAYERRGRFLLAAMVLAGWAAGEVITVAPVTVAPVVAFVSGGIIMNSMLMELPTEREGRFLPFMVGGVGYGLVLLPLG